jgi:uncharacterized protein
MLRMRVLVSAPLLALLAVPLLGGPAAGQFFMREPSDTPVIHSGATAQVQLRADRAVVYIALASRDTLGANAVRDLAATRARVVAALGRVGHRAEEVVPWGYGLGEAVAPGMGPPPHPSTRERTERMARQGLRVVVDRLDRLDAVLLAVVEAGIDAIPMVHFEATRTEEARRRASEQAVADARLQAESLARAAGGRLGPLLSVTTVPDFGPGMSGAERFLSFPPGMDRGAQLLASDLTLRVAVQAAWRFEAN